MFSDKMLLLARYNNRVSFSWCSEVKVKNTRKTNITLRNSSIKSSTGLSLSTLWCVKKWFLSWNTLSSADKVFGTVCFILTVAERRQNIKVKIIISLLALYAIKPMQSLYFTGSLLYFVWRGCTGFSHEPQRRYVTYFQSRDETMTRWQHRPVVQFLCLILHAPYMHRITCYMLHVGI